MSQNKQAPTHPSYCKTCYEWISWDKNIMATIQFIGSDGNPYTGTKRPLNLAKTEPHTCPKQGGNVVINQENKKIVEEEANKKTTTSGSQQKTLTGSSNTGQGSGNNTDLKILVAEAINKIQELDKKMDIYIKETKQSIEKTEHIVESFVSYNPSGTALNNLVEGLLQRIDPVELKPKLASELNK